VAVTWWIPSHGHEYFVPFFFLFFFVLVLIYIHHSSSLSTNQGGPNSEQRIASEQASLLAGDGQFFDGG